MKIGSLAISGKTFLAPLAGVTNLPFRRLVKECGCAVVCSEMISAKGLFYNSQKTVTLLQTDKREKPLSVQIFGREPEIMARAASAIEAMGVADILDINFGCSVKKIIKQGAGAALMQDMENSRAILQAVRKATGLPFTIKIRSGWDRSGSQALVLAKIAQDEGVDALILHPRTATQGFTGAADWHLIRQVKKQISIPIIGNGDIHTAQDAATMTDQTGCDAVMIGRAAMANPFILNQVESFLTYGRYKEISASDIFRKMERLIHLYVNHFGEDTACKMLRGRLPWFVKGLPGCAVFRKKISRIPSKSTARTLIREYEHRLNNMTCSASEKSSSAAQDEKIAKMS
jgi:tRNA-dihydrouridine synthase B